MTVDPVVRTPRLDLVALVPDTLRLVVREDLAGLRLRLGVDVPAGWCTCVPAALLLVQLAEDPSRAAWWTRAMVHRDEGRAVGVAGFHGAPDEHGRVEVGYEVVPSDRRRGFAREATATLLRWAAARGARTCAASIAVDNTASQALARSLGFTRVDTDVHGEDLFLHDLRTTAT